MKITTQIQTPDSDDESQLSLRRIEPKIPDAESVRSELVGPSKSSQPQLQRSVVVRETNLSNLLS